MSGPPFAVLGVAAAVGGWWLTRLAAGAHGRLHWTLAFDALLPALLFATLVALSARPLSSGLLTLAVGGAYAYAERAKRRSLREPIVFTDIFQAVDVFRHPHIAVPFPHRLRILASVLGALAAIVLPFALEPAAGGRPLAALLVLAITLLLVWLAGPGGTWLAAALRRAGLSGEPGADGPRFGALATLLGSGLVARAERDSRLRRLTPPAAPSQRPAAVTRRPVVLVQCESFFDARRLDPAIDRDLLPHFDAACRDALQHGRLAVPCWGANTVRSEFAVLSGLRAADVGLDHLNPYHRFVRRPVDTLAWQLRAAGYRTLCVHPFDKRFYARDQVMPLLGFERFIGDEAFATAPRVNGYVTDAAIADAIETLLAEAHEPTFVFAITIENHGPWPATLSPAARRRAPGIGLSPADLSALERYLASLANADAMLGALMQRDDGRLLGFYGDHQPSLTLTRGTDETSDYLIWRSGDVGAAPRRDLAAHALRNALWTSTGLQAGG